MDKHEAAYGENPHVNYRGQVKPEATVGVGTMFRASLWTHSEDGRQLEFTGLYATREEAELVVAAWVTPSQRGLVYAITQLVSVS